MEEKQVLMSLGEAPEPPELVFVLVPQCPRLLPDHYWTMEMQGARGRSGVEVGVAPSVSEVSSPHEELSPRKPCVYFSGAQIIAYQGPRDSKGVRAMSPHGHP